MWLNKYNKVYLFHFIIFLTIGLVGLVTSSSFKDIIIGIKNILISDGVLITDYMAISNVGVTLINSSITSFLILLLYKINKIKPSGSVIMSMWLILGFSMSGKNFLNIWPPIIGVYIYSKLQNELFSSYILIAVLSTGLSPLSVAISQNLDFHWSIVAIISIVSSIILGMLVAPVAKITLKMHQGYNLYNVGFANGLLSILLISLFKFFGFEFNTKLIWSTEYSSFINLFLIIIFLILIIMGVFRNTNLKYFKILKHSGRSITDFYLIYNNSAYLNMGILGILCLIYINLINGTLNGITVAGIFTIVGFGALGKHILNVTPIAIGVILASLLKGIPLNEPSILVTTLFSTCLAPIAGQFGVKIGILTGFLHLVVLTNIGNLSNGINLYNNGFIGGLIALSIIPIIDGFKKGDM